MHGEDDDHLRDRRYWNSSGLEDIMSCGFLDAHVLFLCSVLSDLCVRKECSITRTLLTEIVKYHGNKLLYFQDYIDLYMLIFAGLMCK